MVRSPQLPRYVDNMYYTLLSQANVIAECHTNYRNNYSVLGDTRTYYDGVPEFVQAGEHQFVQRKLVNMWIGAMQLGW
jgi:CxC5 like cysteine cluster associated with KDZ transposases